MADFILSCCSTVDLTPEHMKRRNLQYVKMHYRLGGKDYLDDLGQTMPYDQFYRAMVDGADTQTSQVNQAEFEEYFGKMLAEGKDVLHVSLSSGISGTYNSAMLAKQTLDKQYPDRKLIVVDSRGASSGYGLLMDELADRRDEGMTIEETAEWAMAHRLNIHHWFFSTDLTFYVKGGRVSKASGFIGSILNICPLLNMEDEGHLIPREKIRTKRKVIHTLVERMEEHAQGGTGYTGKVYISESDCMEDAQAVAQLVRERFPHIRGDVEIYSIGTTIGSHTGPGTVALFFLGDERGK